MYLHADFAPASSVCLKSFLLFVCVLCLKKEIVLLLRASTFAWPSNVLGSQAFE